VLDAACGSGGHALALAKWGYSVSGADISAEMLALARRKATKAGLEDLAFVQAGLDELPEQFPAAQVDAVICLGNSLPHLLSQEDLLAALRSMAAMLRPGGLLVMQNLNYDLRWRTRPRFFAAQGGTLDGKEVLVWRFADYDQPAGRIAFHIALFRKDQADWHVEVHTTPQRPWFAADLVAALESAGFGEIRSYGLMALPLTPFDPHTSADLVLVARKLA
jgi:SAM-dependent methyltransferase